MIDVNPLQLQNAPWPNDVILVGIIIEASDSQFEKHQDEIELILVGIVIDRGDSVIAIKICFQEKSAIYSAPTATDYSASYSGVKQVRSH